METKKKYSKVKMFVLRSTLNVIGVWRKLWFKKGKKYHGGRNNRDGVYMGDGKFYETFYVHDIGVSYFDSKMIQYKNWELGLWKWQRRT